MSLSLTGVVITIISYLLLTYVLIVFSTLGSVHTLPDKFENVTLFLRLGLPSTLSGHENGAFRKWSSKKVECENTCSAFWCRRKSVWKEAFGKRWQYNNHVISQREFSSNTNPKWPVIVAFSNFSSEVWTGQFNKMHSGLSLCAKFMMKSFRVPWVVFLDENLHSKRPSLPPPYYKGYSRHGWLVEATIQNPHHAHSQGAGPFQPYSNTEREVQNNIHQMSILLTLNCLFAFFCSFLTIYLEPGSDRHTPLSHIRVSLATAIGAGHVIFLAGIDAAGNKVGTYIYLEMSWIFSLSFEPL